MIEWLFQQGWFVLLDEFQALLVGLIALGFSIFLHFHDKRK